MKNDPIAFMPGVHGSDPQAQYWLRQVTLRLRREVCWLWRERLAQGGDAGAADPKAGGLPPFVDPALGALDLARYADDKQAFFLGDVTARHLSDRLAEPPPGTAVGAPARGSFGWVVAELGLDATESFVLALALLPAIDSAAGPVIACCLDEPGRMDPSLALAQRLVDAPQRLLACFDPGHALYARGLLAHPPADWSTPLKMAPLVASALLFPDADAVPTSPRPSRRRVTPVLGPAGAALAEAARDAAGRAGLGLMQPTIVAGGDHLRTLMTLAWLRGDALYLAPAWLAAHDPHAPAGLPLPCLPVSLYLGVHDAAAIHRLGEDDARLPAIEVAPSGYAERLAAWRRVVPSAARRPILAELARRFRCETSVIERIGAELRSAGREPSADELLAAARADIDLGALAQAVEPRFRLAELMLPPAQTRQIAEIVTAMVNLGRVHHEWGTAQAWNEGGLAALFAGPPGTGKTMASEAIARELGLPMVRIDLSQVVNKYIGETEKNLKRLFDAADAADTILFFDEADALFGKRTEVKDAHDRYANLEISYLLERMERFKGLAILATNRRKDLDEAFLRRLRFVVEFPLPGLEERLRIWRSVVPPGIDAAELDFDFLARRFPLAGGHIRAIVFHACLQSADADAPRRLTMQGVVRAVQREYAKLERASSLDQFGPYAPLVAADEVPR